MYLERITPWLAPWDECRVLDRERVFGPCTLAAAALTRKGKEVTLWLVQHDSTLLERQDLLLREGDPPCPKTNREQLRQNHRHDDWDRENLAMAFPVEVTLGGRCCAVSEARMTRVQEDWDSIFALEALMRGGWTPGALIHCDTGELFLTSCVLEGDFDAIPDPEGPITLRPRRQWDAEWFECAAEVPLVEKCDPIPLTTPGGALVYLTGAELMDPWEHLEKTLSDPKVQHIPPAEREAARRRAEAIYSEYCPRGMAFPIVRYEAEAELSLQGYLTRWLDAPVEHSKSGCFGIAARPDEETFGPRGLPIRCFAMTERPLPLAAGGPIAIGALTVQRRRALREVTL